MDIQKMKFFIDLAETKNYTETAERLFTTQSNVSKQIISLEKELDTYLFDRTRRHIELTEAGKTLLPYAHRILEDYYALWNATSPYRNSESSMLKIYAIPVMAQYKITGLIADFHKKHTEIRLDIEEIESANLMHELDEGHCDIAYARIFSLDENKYEKITLEYDHFTAVLPKDHALANQKIIDIAQLKDENFLQLDKSTCLLDHVCSICKKSGFLPKIGYTGTLMDNILGLVSNGMGISLMMQHAVESMHHSGIKLVPLADNIKSELAFVRLKGIKHTKASNLFWNEFQNL